MYTHFYACKFNFTISPTNKALETILNEQITEFKAYPPCKSPIQILNLTTKSGVMETG